MQPLAGISRVAHRAAGIVAPGTPSTAPQASNICGYSEIFTVAGMGYNSIMGFPLSFGQSSKFPGLPAPRQLPASTCANRQHNTNDAPSSNDANIACDTPNVPQMSTPA